MLVDPSDEGADILFSPLFRKAERAAIAVNLLLARLRLLDVVHRSAAAPLPEDARLDTKRDGFSVHLVTTHRAQARTFLDELATFRNTPPELGDVPLTDPALITEEIHFLTTSSPTEKPGDA